MSADRLSRPESSVSATLAPVVRIALFTLLVFAAVLGIWGLAKQSSLRLFSEGSNLEWFQFGGLVLASVLAVIGARLVPARRAIFILLAIFPALGAIREQDRDLDILIPFGGWQLPFFLIVGGMAVFAWKQRARLLEQLPELLRHRAFGMMWAGLMIGIPFGQMIGHGTFLSGLFGEDYHRSFKRVIEESAESLGYLIILIAITDWLLDSLAGRKQNTAQGPR